MTAAPSAPAGSETTRPARSLDPRFAWILIGATVALGAALRFDNLGAKSLWLDEVIGSQATRFNSFADLIAWVKADIDQVPAFATITWLLRGLGDGEVALRLPSAVAGTLCIAVVYVFAKRLYGITVALVAALLMAVLPFAVWYSQEARPYALLMLLTTLQMLFAFRAGRDGRLLDWSGLAFLSILNLYTHYMAIAATAAAFSYLGGCLVLDALGGKPNIRQASRVVASAALVALAYLPWLHALAAFLRSSNKGFGRYSPAQEVSLTQLGVLIGGLSYGGVLLLALGLGLLAAMVRAVKRRDGSGLLVAWFVLPVAALAVKLRGGALYVEPRYLSFLVPVMVILTAVAVNDVAGLLSTGARRLRQLRSTQLAGLGAVALTAVLMVQAIPALASTLAQPKDDYRGLARYVTGVGPPGSTVLALGQYASFVVIGMGHYLDQTGSSIVVANGAEMDDRLATRLTAGSGVVWGAVFQPSDAEVLTAAANGLQVNRTFTGLLLVRPASDLAPVDQARTLLTWDSTWFPRIRSSLDVLGVVAGVPPTGPDILTGRTNWYLSPGATSTSGGTFRLRPSGQEVGAALVLNGLTAGNRYVVTFRYRNNDLKGSQRVMIIAGDTSGQQLDTFPNSTGYVCSTTGALTLGVFGVTIPQSAQTLTIWLRANGTGEADFEDIEMRTPSS